MKKTAYHSRAQPDNQLHPLVRYKKRSKVVIYLSKAPVLSSCSLSALLGKKEFFRNRIQKIRASKETSTDVTGVFNHIPSNFNDHITGNNATGISSAFLKQKVLSRGSGSAKQPKNFVRQSQTTLLKMSNCITAKHMQIL